MEHISLPHLHACIKAQVVYNKPANKLQQVCSQANDKLCFVGTSLQQAVKSLMGLSDLLQGCSSKTGTVMI